MGGARIRRGQKEPDGGQSQGRRSGEEGRAGQLRGVPWRQWNRQRAGGHSAEPQSETDGALFWKITSGRGAMPAWRHLAENDRWALVQYIRSLKK